VGVETMLTILSSYDSYENSINFLLKSMRSKSTAPLNWGIIKSASNIEFRLKSLEYSTTTGIVDLNLQKLFKHSFMHIHFEYLVNLLQFLRSDTKNIFSGANLNFLSSTSLLFTLTSKGITQFQDLNVLKYVDVSNHIIANKQFVGGLGIQYISAMHTIMNNKDLQNISNLFYYSDYMAFSNTLYDELLINIDSNVNDLARTNYFKVENVSDYINLYTDIVKTNKVFVKESFEQYIFDFQR
jgi:hypothetical protein